MPAALSCIFYFVIGILAIPVVVLTIQVFYAIMPGARRSTPMSAKRPPLAILVPAHDEAEHIGATCKALGAFLASGDRLLVVADNCADDTASLARAAGAEVVERCDLANKGKGYALDFGIRHLAREAPAVLIVVDADCTLSAGSIDCLARACSAVGHPVQAVYSMRSHPGAPLRLRIAEFAGIVKNVVRPLGNLRLGLPCMLMGTGMAFPWPAIASANLATGHIVEDMKLGIDLAIMGSAPVYCPEAEIESYFPETPRGFNTQRTRWEHGHLGLILSEFPRLFLAALGQRNWQLLAIALDLAVPPLALLTLLIVGIVAASIQPAMVYGETGPLWLSVAVFILLGVSVFTAWAQFARHVVSGRELVFAPVYALLKVPMYLRFLYAKQVAWIRSARKGE